VEASLQSFQSVGVTKKPLHPLHVVNSNANNSGQENFSRRNTSQSFLLPPSLPSLPVTALALTNTPRIMFSPPTATTTRSGWDRVSNDPHQQVHLPVQVQEQSLSGNNSNRFEESMLSLGDPFDGFDHKDNYDNEEEEEEEEEENVTRNASATSLKSSTSKRRLHRRRQRPKQGEELHGSMTSTGSSDRSLKIRSRASSARNVTTASLQDSVNRNGKSLSDFLDKRKKTLLLPGSTTQDLCTDMNHAVARAKMGPSSSRMSIMASNKQSLPGRSSTAPGLMRRNTVEGISSSSPGYRMRDYSQTSTSSGGGMRLRDYSQPGLSTRRTATETSGPRRMP
jgi:hypothetical protein